MLLRDQIVIQVGEELDGMVMIRSGDNRQGVCPVKFLQEVWQLSEANCLSTCACSCLKKEPPDILDKIYYPNPITAPLPKNNNWYKNKKPVNNNILSYHNNINNEKNKQTNVLQGYQKNAKLTNTKAPFSSTKRPLSIRLSTPKHHFSNFFSRLNRVDSQKRPLLLNFNPSDLSSIKNFRPNFKIIPEKSGLKISTIYTISENVEKFTMKNSYRRNLYISSNSRPLFVRK